ncbi:YdbC family protein [Alkalihalophilus pseudofirmus]|uniref:YdbC family protein n=1 Tax=Alkalihalophilus pseudofirmus TaxID=79885 RepID=UPI00259B9FB4|nr:YdbC family protein [Alkalihalophilus pseudofirmus]WEG18878.1 YdbC family protein [Alkalihalophilus pseudofirmus]
MIIKRISCIVKDDQREAFQEYQKQWGHLSKVKGFLGQIGGWSIKQPLTAWIYSFWENQVDYQQFMKGQHDQIFVNSGQENTYESIDVTLYDEKLKVPGSEDNILNILKDCQYIRVTLTQVKEDQLKNFIDMQKNVWNIGMIESEGMLGGTIAFLQRESNGFLVFTGWESACLHENYTQEIFPELFKTAKPQNYIFELTGEQFKVEEEWRVLSKECHLN